MIMLFWLIILGLMTYWLLQRGVAQITRTPVWLLWLVMMTPAFIWGTWIWIYDQKPIPAELVIIPFIVCPCLYWFLVQWGRLPPPSPESDIATPKNSILPLEKPSLPRPLDQQEEDILRSCFPWTVFPLHNIEYRLQSVICRGQLRSNPDRAYQTIRDNIKAKFSDRFLIAFQQDLQDKPFFALVPNPYQEKADSIQSQPLSQPILALCLFLITLFTTTVAGVEMADIPLDDWQDNPSLLLAGLPYSIALMVILGIHESAHYLTARWYKINATLPYFIPIPFWLGTVGAFIQMRSPFPHRQALFDISIVRVLSGFIISLPLLILGLSQSTVVPFDPKISGFLNFESLNPSFSFLLTVLSKFILGAGLTSEHAINLHPVAIAGYLGLIITAFNLIPIGQLDGGHIVHAMLGQKTSLIIGQVARFLILILGLIHSEFLIFALLLFFFPLQDEPALNDVSELNNIRDIIGLSTLGLLLLIILPMPSVIAQLLNY
ncbi:site-2 protease family protein [Planktothrix agardhii 1806]|uniref:site-2 protease family protein n=1 Tax=Planktothrix agardhii TaxID=1160 RepID=UPI001F412BFF|nr:site-2 protease family protein [Planktothrix agardhii]MCF3600903.1 site-2 protease family protein [Planktothrix agardhii 1804]MCF3618189.1 site-2 protease family protein [Planktothrix agardhii 1806]